MENDQPTNGFDFDKANLADQITVIGNCEHAFMHACKTASTLKENEAVFYMTLAEMIKDYRREFMREHFPKVEEKDWCLIKALETIRQRVYESANTSYKDLKGINILWAMTMEHIFGIDMSSCVACAEDKGEKDENSIKETEGCPIEYLEEEPEEGEEV